MNDPTVVQLIQSQDNVAANQVEQWSCLGPLANYASYTAWALQHADTLGRQCVGKPHALPRSSICSFATKMCKELSQANGEKSQRALSTIRKRVARRLLRGRDDA